MTAMGTILFSQLCIFFISVQTFMKMIVTSNELLAQDVILTLLLGTCAQSTQLTSFDVLHSTFSCPIVYEDGRDQMRKSLQGTAKYAARESERVRLSQRIIPIVHFYGVLPVSKHRIVKTKLGMQNHTAFLCCSYCTWGQTFSQLICLVVNMFMIY